MFWACVIFISWCHYNQLLNIWYNIYSRHLMMIYRDALYTHIHGPSLFLYCGIPPLLPWHLMIVIHCWCLKHTHIHVPPLYLYCAIPPLLPWHLMMVIHWDALNTHIHGLSMFLSGCQLLSPEWWSINLVSNIWKQNQPSKFHVAQKVV